MNTEHNLRHLLAFQYIVAKRGEDAGHAYTLLIQYELLDLLPSMMFVGNTLNRSRRTWASEISVYYPAKPLAERFCRITVTPDFRKGCVKTCTVLLEKTGKKVPIKPIDLDALVVGLYEALRQTERHVEETGDPVGLFQKYLEPLRKPKTKRRKGCHAKAEA